MGRNYNRKKGALMLDGKNGFLVTYQKTKSRNGLKMDKEPNISVEILPRNMFPKEEKIMKGS